MENASKALLMAGGILMALLVIGGLLYMHNQISAVEQTRSDVEASQSLETYSRKFEQYNKIIYGSELMSLANLQDDYNATQTGVNGYEMVNITITIKNSISGSNYFLAGTKNVTSISEDKNRIEDLIKQYEETRVASSTNKLYKNKGVKYYSQISNREIAQIYGINYSSSDTDYDVGDMLKNQGGEIRKLMEDITQYKNIKSIYTEFKNKRFRCEQVGYGETGRVNLMKFTEV